MVGLSPQELYSLELAEFGAIYEGWLRLYRQRSRENWERTRWSTARIASLWLDKRANVQELFALPWDPKPPEAAPSVDPEDIEARKARALELLSQVELSRNG
jgi:hypothetical protein